MAAHRFGLRSLVIVMFAAAVLTCVCSPAWSDVHRDEIVLSYDDGTPETSITGQTAVKVAVRFQAPPEATLLVAVEIYIMDDGVVDPNDPLAPTTMPFTLWVWRPTEAGVPGVPANDGYVPFEAYTCPEDTLLRVYLTDPIDLSDQSVFPDAEFFVGLEWEQTYNPVIGVDTDEPSYNSLRWNWTTWDLVEGNIIIHAVVSDQMTPVEVRPWAAIKAMFR